VPASATCALHVSTALALALAAAAAAAGAADRVDTDAGAVVTSADRGPERERGRWRERERLRWQGRCLDRDLLRRGTDSEGGRRLDSDREPDLDRDGDLRGGRLLERDLSCPREPCLSLESECRTGRRWPLAEDPDLEHWRDLLTGEPDLMPLRPRLCADSEESLRQAMAHGYGHCLPRSCRMAAV